MEKNQSIRFQLDRYFRIDEFFTFDSRWREEYTTEMNV